MAAQIVIDDGTNPPVVGTVDRDNTFIGTAFTLSNFNNANILAWRWELTDRPIGSAAVLTSTTASTTQFTPDVPGTYQVRLQTYTDVGATVLDDQDDQSVGVRFGTSFDWRVPAAGETSQFDTDRGWAVAREEAIRDLHAFISSGIASLIGASNEQEGNIGVPRVMGGFQFNAGLLPTNSITLRFIGILDLNAGAAPTQGRVRLYDMGPIAGPAQPGDLRATATIDDTDDGDVVVKNVTLTPQATVTPGANDGTILNTARLWELRLLLEGAGALGGDTIKCHWAGLVIGG